MKEKIMRALALAKQLCFDMEADKNRDNKELLEVQTLEAVEAAEKVMRDLVPRIGD